MNQEKTILGVTLRRRIITTVNGMGRGEGIRVHFKGTRAYTNGKDIVLPAIKDMAEIPYSVARALIGYAIHEVFHIRYTDFEAIIRAIEAGKMKPDKLIKKFENCIEDYRIERDGTVEYPGAVGDLTALRVLIHPKLSKLKPAWLADPRACGPLALTWTGSAQLNGFVIPDVQPTLDAMPSPVLALIDNWTDRMKDVGSTEEAVDLAIAFHAEAMAYANASRPQQQQPQQQPSSQDDSDPQDQEDDAVTSSASDQSDADDKQQGDDQPESSDEPASSDDAEQDQDQSDEPASSQEQDAGDQDQADQADSADDAEPGDGEDAEAGDGEGGPDGQPGDGDTESNGADDQQGSDGEAADSTADSGDGNTDQAGDPSSEEEGNSSEGDEASDGQGGAAGDEDTSSSSADGSGSSDGQSSEGEGSDQTGDDTGDGDQPGDSSDGVDDLDFGSNSSSGNGQGKPNKSGSDPSGSIDMNDGLTDEYDDGSPKDQTKPGPGQQQGSSSQQPGDQTEEAAGDDAASQGPAGPAGDQSSDDVSEAGDADEDDGSDPFKDVLDDDAPFDDFLDDLRDAIAENPLPEDEPEAADGEVDPSEVLKQVAKANKAAPSYTSPDPSSPDDQDGEGGGPDASKNHYNDNRFIPVEQAGEENLFGALMAAASGVISTTARTIRRLLMAEEQRGTLRNRRDGQFDIRNISSIVRQTGNCYKQKWERPAPETHLTILCDFSGSMSSNWANLSGPRPIELAMTGALAIEEATRNTSISTSLYGYTGRSPNVFLFTFKEGRQSQIVTRRKIGAYGNLEMDCTPTGEAMCAAAELLEGMPNKRRILLVLTDGTADDTTLCKAVVPVIERRGTEVVAIGINMPNVREWCSNSYVINDVGQLPEALLKVIDPRANKKPRRLAA
jgi:hypothetical protein